MIKTRLYLDTRRLNKEKKGQLRLIISKKGKTSMLSLGFSLLVHQWNNGTIVNHPSADVLNRALSVKIGIINQTILESSAIGAFCGLSAKEIAEILKEKLDPDIAIERRRKEEERALTENSFILYFEKQLPLKDNPGTRQLYHDTLNKVIAFCKEEKMNTYALSFSDISVSWLKSFEKYCLLTEKQNTVARHLRDIRAIFNDAIDEEKTSLYPFRKFKIRHETTIDKSFSAKELRVLFNAKAYHGGEEEALDIFKLMFFLIGINSVDLAYATPPINDRLNYIRRKTHKPYTIKIEPEAQAIINKYQGNNYMLNILERTPNYKTYFNRLGKTLKRIGLIRVPGKESKGAAILPDVCTGSARTSWATIAQEELDISREIIAAALGHHTIDVTSTYLRTDWKKKIDAANRAVMDWVLYEKKTIIKKN